MPYFRVPPETAPHGRDGNRTRRFRVSQFILLFSGWLIFLGRPPNQYSGTTQYPFPQST